MVRGIERKAFSPGGDLSSLDSRRFLLPVFPPFIGNSVFLPSFPVRVDSSGTEPNDF